MIDKNVFFNGWHAIVEVLVLGVIGCAALIMMLRAARKRTLAQMNVFDFVFVVMMGEILVMTIMSEEIPLAKGLTALALLIALQGLLSWLTTKSTAVEHVINGEPTLLLHHGRLLHDAMRSQRVTEAEVLAAAREEGIADLCEIQAVVLETNGSFSVIHTGRPSQASTLRDAPGLEYGGELVAASGAHAHGD